MHLLMSGVVIYEVKRTGVTGLLLELIQSFPWVTDYKDFNHLSANPTKWPVTAGVPHGSRVHFRASLFLNII